MSWVLAAVGVMSVVVNAGLVGRIVARLGERRTLLLGLGCGAVRFLIYGLADVGWIFLLGLPVGALWALAAPATQALITQEVGPEEQGRIQGALMSLVSLAGILGPALFAGSFGYFIGDSAVVQLPGAPWYIAALLLGVGALLGSRYARDPTQAGARSAVDIAPEAFAERPSAE